MSVTSSNAPISNHRSSLVPRNPLARFFDALVWMAENSSRGRQVTMLSKLTDEDLVKCGTTRLKEVERICAGYMY